MQQLMHFFSKPAHHHKRRKEGLRVEGWLKSISVPLGSFVFVVKELQAPEQDENQEQ
eukprot:NODE_7313_length_462_cov_22.900726_g6482_i0.p2 GENE.NODE_7313_length_462_cov_22.900726_g6482_i0~~NODE_7313_length_462_cov_22.900726_g6482_i0.p2  ORF type:complete len:57 (+),score=14.77 NODE_7313_length_462_cov_22.900726_g6482_i0:74-244(+)